ncbi:uncharacterized protein LOC134621241 [Pelmatolapia mariae]|uniref:uncharacterized protein LOC134621241 n=1 Tax=Pelmatolapia mariae TaxID=158779 RepID=UPI003211DDE3
MSQVSGRACAPSPWVLRTVAMGYRLQFRVKPPRFQRVVNTTVNTEAAMILREEIKALLQKRAIRVVPASETDKGWYSRYFVVPKKGGGLRPILDLRVLNTYLRTYRFKMLTLRQLLNAVGPGDWFATIDLTDACFHVAIHPKHRQFLRFAFEGVAYEYLVLPFGLSLAPRTFTKCAEAVLAPLRERGIRILAYLDDWALVACSREQAETQLSLVLSHIQTLGFSVNFQKSSLIPSQQITFLGLEICSLSSRARLSEHRVAAFHRCLAQFQLGRRLRFQTILSLLGMMASMIAVVPLGLLKMRAFQRWTLFHRLCASRHLRRRLSVTASCMLALHPWREPRLLHQGSRIGRVLFHKVVSTDASLRGWGALCEGASVRGIWSAAQHQLHINHLELLAVFLALKHFRPVLQGQHVLVRTDNSTVVSYINRQGGTRSLPLLQLSRSLLLWCSVHFLSLRATHVLGHLNLGPDLLSRGGPLVREWRLHPLIVAQMWDLFGKAQLDLFASRVNTHCPLYFSIIDHNAPLGLDALAHQWPDVLLYAFPPVEMISPVLERVRRHSLSLILVAPWWPARSWYAEIISLLAASPWQLPLRRDLLSQAGGEVFHPRPELNLAAKGLPPSVIATIQSARASSTRGLYAYKWRAFEQWCQDRHTLPFQCSIVDVLTFLQELLDKGLSFSTIKVYLAAISACHIGFDGVTPGAHPLAIRFLKGVRQLRPMLKSSVPAWDLSLVLEALCSPPFEPIESVDMKFLSYKTALLLTLASAKRVGDLHALSVHPSCTQFSPGGHKVVLRPNAAYFPKVMPASYSSMEFELLSFCSPPFESEEQRRMHSLCPVRVLRTYIERTQNVRLCDQLFVCFANPNRGRALSKQRLSHWIIEAVSLAYGTRGLALPHGVRAHSTRGMATSWALFRGVPVADICAAASWASPHTFVRFYRLDVTAPSVAHAVLSAGSTTH